MFKTDPVQLNFYSKYNRAKQKQNINSLYHLIDNNVENIKHIEQLTIVVNGSRKGSINNSPDRVLEEQSIKKSQLSLGKQKVGKLFYQSRHKEKIVEQKKKKIQFLDQIYIHRQDPMEKSLVKKKATYKRQNIKSFGHSNILEKQMSEKIRKSETQPKIYSGSNRHGNVLKPQLLMLGSFKSQLNFVNEKTNNGYRSHPKLKYQGQNIQITEKDFQSIKKEINNNQKSIVINNNNLNSRLDKQNKGQTQNKTQLRQYQQKIDIQNQPQTDGLINQLFLKVNQVPEQFRREQQSQYVNQFEIKAYIGTEVRQTPKVHLLDIPEQHGELRNESVEQQSNKNKDANIEPRSFKNVFYPQPPSFINLQQYQTVNSSPKSLGIHSLQTFNHTANVDSYSNDFNHNPLTIVKVQDKQIQSEKKIVFKKLLVANKLHLSPGLATSTVYSGIIPETIPINNRNNVIQNTDKPTINQKSPSPQLSKVNFKSMFQKNKNSKSGSPNNMQYLSPEKEVAKSSLNYKLLMGFFNQN